MKLDDSLDPLGEHFGCTMAPGRNGKYRCVGYHCGACGKPSSSQGHAKCFEEKK